MLPLLALLAATALGQSPAPASTSASTAEADALEAKHLKNIRQVTSGFSKAGEGYFRPDGKPSSSRPPCPARTTTRSTRRTSPPARSRSSSARARGNARAAIIIPTASRSSSPRPTSTPALETAARRQAQGPRLQPDRALSLGLRPGHGHLQGRPRRLEPRPPDRHPRLRRRGELLARRASRSSSRRSATATPRSTSWTPTARTRGGSPHAKGYDGGPFFSPDGKKILYRSDRKENDLLQVFINTPDGKNERQLDAQRRRQLGPVLLPGQPAHRLRDEPARPPELRALLDGHRHRQAGADHLPRGLRRPARLQPRRQAS